MLESDADINVPLYVDLDGTLVRSDLLVESIMQLLRTNLFYVFLFPLWLCHGKAFFKQCIADRTEIDVATLPYNKSFLEFLRHEFARGRELILATAANRKFAEQVSAHIGILKRVLASDDKTNMSSKTKLQHIKKLSGERHFDYAGNAKADLPIWQCARHALIVSPEGGVQEAVARSRVITRLFDADKASWRTYMRALRLQQWSKNILIFIPVLAAHNFTFSALMEAVGAFLSFGLIASSVYLVNDLVDLPLDRTHPRKRRRPFASGAISAKKALVLVPGLIACGVAIALLVGTPFLLVLALYSAITIAYSFRLKRVPIVDVMTLASLYTIRVLAGAAATMTVPSFWLLVFSMFIFLSLALAKRSAELIAFPLADGVVSGRGYAVSDLQHIHGMGVASGYMAVLVAALYVNNPTVAALYDRPYMLWLICPILLYWISRLWLKTGRGEMHDDPVVFAVTDRSSQIIAILVTIVVILAS